MTAVRRRLPLFLLLVLVVVGLRLVVTGDADGVELERVTTADGVVVDVPGGWVVSSDFSFQYVPPTVDGNGLDFWSVAWACPPEECGARSLAEWLDLAPDLPTFTSAREDADIALFDLDETSDDNWWVLAARTNNGLRIVNVAVFHDGADHYLACNLSVLGDPGGLDDAIIEACRSAEVP